MSPRRSSERRSLIYALVACFIAGGFVDWWARTRLLVEPAASEEIALADLPPPSATPSHGARRPGSPADRSDVDHASIPTDRDGAADAQTELRQRGLQLPVDAALVESMRGQFNDKRSGHTHEAVDLMAPRNSPVHAVEDGTIARLFLSKAGGTTIYQFDPGQRFCYYYAHLAGYAEGLREGQSVSKGQVLGYVGTTGNAPPNAPHLHFAIFELTPAKHWWQGRAIDPFTVFSTVLPISRRGQVS
jgi:murein DD-endopeptidase MepM/ murein hydrolase activator NlpD